MLILIYLIISKSLLRWTPYLHIFLKFEGKLGANNFIKMKNQSYHNHENDEEDDQDRDDVCPPVPGLRVGGNKFL